MTAPCVKVSHGAIQFMVYEELRKLATEAHISADELGSKEISMMGAASKLAASLVTYPQQVYNPFLSHTHTDLAPPLHMTCVPYAHFPLLPPFHPLLSLRRCSPRCHSVTSILSAIYVGIWIPSSPLIASPFSPFILGQSSFVLPFIAVLLLLMQVSHLFYIMACK
jgi:hypothetical protein